MPNGLLLFKDVLWVLHQQSPHSMQVNRPACPIMPHSYLQSLLRMTRRSIQVRAKMPRHARNAMPKQRFNADMMSYAAWVQLIALILATGSLRPLEVIVQMAQCAEHQTKVIRSSDIGSGHMLVPLTNLGRHKHA